MMTKKVLKAHDHDVVWIVYRLVNLNLIYDQDMRLSSVLDCSLVMNTVVVVDDDDDVEEEEEEDDDDADVKDQNDISHFDDDVNVEYVSDLMVELTLVLKNQARTDHV